MANPYQLISIEQVDGLAAALAEAGTPTAAEVLDLIKTVDGPGSGLDADLLDGLNSDYFLPFASYTAADVLSKLLTVDGAGSGVDADTLDGYHASSFVMAGSTYVNSFNTRTGAVTLTSGDVTTALGFTPLNATAYTAADVLSKLLTVDGAGTGLDADLLDGQHGSYYANSTHTHTFSSLTSKPTTLAGYGITDAMGSAGGTFTGNVTLSKANPSITLDDTTYAAPSTLGMLRFYSAAGNLYLTRNTSTARSFATESTIWVASTSTGVVQFTETPLASGGNVVWHAGNDGASSGLDADLLDGQQGSFYQNAGNLNAGTLLAARMPAFTGDITTSAGAIATTLATVNGNVGSFGSATQVAVFTVNAKGLTTAASNVTITPAWGSVTSKPTTLSGYSITASDVLTTLMTVDGAASGLDADLLDGQHGSYYAPVSSPTFNTDIEIIGSRPRVTLDDNSYTAGVSAVGLFELEVNGSFSVRRNTALARDFSTSEDDLVITTAGVAVFRVTPTVSGGGTVWHSANDGASSGLDADLLDGQHGSYYNAASNLTGTIDTARLPVVLGTSRTINSSLTILGSTPHIILDDSSYTVGDATGLWRWYSNSGALYLRRNTSTDRDFSTQEDALLFNASGVATFLNVPFVSGSVMWHAGNDGAGSGLDADLLDGQQGSYYLAASTYTAADVLAKLLTADGAGTGLDADLLDGQQGTYYTDIAARLGYVPMSTAASGLDWNVSTPDIGRFIANTTNGPLGVGGTTIGIHIPYAAGYAMQIAGRANNLWFRGLEASTWGSWYTIWHTGNDGSGSGLDADLLDSYQAADFPRKAEGATISGAWTFSAAPTMSAGVVSTAAEGYRVSNDTGYYAWFNTANNSRRGYLQHSGTTMTLANEVTNSNFNFTFAGTGELRSGGNKIWHAGNDGASSTLDADLLDGQHGSYYQNASNINAGTINNSYLPTTMSAKTFTGSVAITGAAATYRELMFFTGSSLRWDMFADPTAESGSNAGSNFVLARYSDAGAYLGVALSIGRSNGVASFEATPYVGGNVMWHAGNDGAGTGLDADLLDGLHASAFYGSGGGTLSGNISFSNTRYGLVGVYDAAQTQAIWAMGSSYVLTLGGASTVYGNHYGLAWSYNPDYGGAGNNPQSKAGLNHQLLIQNAGVTQTAIGTGIWTNGNITVSGGQVSGASGYNANPQPGTGFRLWGIDTTYGIQMSPSGDASFGGQVTSESTSDYNTYFSMAAATNRGWVFRSGTTPVAGIDGAGNVRSKGFFKSSKGLTDLGTTLGSTLSSRYVMPGGASYTSQLASVTGAIKIRLPTLRSSAMLKMRVEVFNYNTGTSKTFVISGYPYDGTGTTNWVNITAEQFGETSGPFSARFGHDGTGDCVWIGETSSVWQYPQVFITEFMHGYSGHSDNWASNWSVTFVTSFNTITAGPRSCSVYWNSINDGAASGLDADLLDGQEGAYYLAWANITSKPTTLAGYGITDAVWKSGSIATNTWHTSADGIQRFYFGASSHTYVKTAGDFYLRNASDVHIMTVTSGGAMSASASIAAPAVTATSDISLKTNIQDLKTPMWYVNQMRPVTYDRLDTKRSSIGFIAQEFQKFLPELVLELDDGILSIEYGQVTAILAGALKEAHSQIEALTARMDRAGL